MQQFKSRGDGRAELGAKRAKRRSGSLPPKNFFEATPLRTSENAFSRELVHWKEVCFQFSRLLSIFEAYDNICNRISFYGITFGQHEVQFRLKPSCNWRKYYIKSSRLWDSSDLKLVATLGKHLNIQLQPHQTTVSQFVKVSTNVF